MTKPTREIATHKSSDYTGYLLKDFVIPSVPVHVLLLPHLLADTQIKTLDVNMMKPEVAGHMLMYTAEFEDFFLILIILPVFVPESKPTVLLPKAATPLSITQRLCVTDECWMFVRGSRKPLNALVSDSGACSWGHTGNR